ncbi:hypothetical protein HFN65_31490 [Rhizobium laguerreae]|uniref:hypothetical protein n=1 Tax=Rhizobium laguerreae TaxID=1076926 RepID=UPI001C91754E|nr:hypothetical protein [Rhizobium laguerreae]MBY3575464.1 hypothetical protein [Rhizobium laguerreae]
MARVFLLSLCTALSLQLSAPARAAPGDIYAEIMAVPSGSSISGQEWFATGHAFICISLHLNSGIKEDCYGFYSVGNTIEEVLVGGSDLLDEFNETPSKWANINWSFKKKISVQQRLDLLRLIDAANIRDYQLFKYNCGDFVYDVVQKLGWENTAKGLLPDTYVRDLVAKNIKRFLFERNNHTDRLDRSGPNWLQINGSSGNVSNTYIHRGHDEQYISMDDGAKGVVEIQAPLKGGTALERLYRRGNWHPYSNTPLRPEFD